MPKPPTGAATAQSLSVSIYVDVGANTKTLTFNKPVSPQEASGFLWGNLSNAALLKPVGALVGGKAQRFTLETHDIATIMSLKPEVQAALGQASQLRSTAKP